MTGINSVFNKEKYWKSFQDFYETLTNMYKTVCLMDFPMLLDFLLRVLLEREQGKKRERAKKILKTKINVSFIILFHSNSLRFVFLLLQLFVDFFHFLSTLPHDYLRRNQAKNVFLLVIARGFLLIKWKTYIIMTYTYRSHMILTRQLFPIPKCL